MLNNRSDATSVPDGRADGRHVIADVNTLHDAYSVSGNSPPSQPQSSPSRTWGQPPRLAYTPEEAASALGMSRSLFYERVLPHLKTVRLGRKRIIAIAELELFLSTHASRALP